jgi:hypothetical protein
MRALTETLTERLRPIIELCIPSALDGTLAPPGQHVVSLFVQYAPYKLREGSWADGTLKQRFADHGTYLLLPYTLTYDALTVTHTHTHMCTLTHMYTNKRAHTHKHTHTHTVFSIIDQYAPNFSASVVGRDVLSPWDLEQTFGLTGGVRAATRTCLCLHARHIGRICLYVCVCGCMATYVATRLLACVLLLARFYIICTCVCVCLWMRSLMMVRLQNIFHGSMGLHQLYYSRPVREASGHATPLRGYYLCGSGAHPGACRGRASQGYRGLTSAVCLTQAAASWALPAATPRRSYCATTSLHRRTHVLSSTGARAHSVHVPTADAEAT